MKYGTMILFLLWVLVVTPGRSVIAQEWRRLVPLESTRAEVERLLGPREKHYGLSYELPDGTLSIEYSSGPCRPDRRGGWNVPEDVVISFTFTLKRKQLARDLRLDLKKYKKEKDPHLPFVYYINDDEGVMYTIQKGIVESIEYYPPKKYEYLQCEHSHSPQERSRRTQYPFLQT